MKFEPDLLVVYMGNNEVVGSYGPGSVLSGPIPARWRIHLDLWLRSTRTGQLVQRTLNSLRPSGSDFKDWRGMEMFTRAAVNADDPRLAVVYDNFAANLDDILASARDAGVKVVLSTVAVNSKDCAPFVSQHHMGLSSQKILAWQQYVSKASRAGDIGDSRAEGLNLSLALENDPTYADSHFRLARVLETTGDLPAARQHYAEALQFDALRFRADSRINSIIRQAARSASANVTLMDAAKELGSEPGNSGIVPAGANLFFEHVHFRWEGNYALAKLLSPAIWSALHEQNVVSQKWLDSAACADALGYTEFGHLSMARGMSELTRRPPFTGQSSYAEDRTRLLTEISDAEAALSRTGAVATIVAKIDTALRYYPHNTWLLFQAASVRLQAGDFPSALNLNDQLRAILPWSPEVEAQKAFLLLQLDRKNEAEELLLHSAGAAPFYFQTYGLLTQFWFSTDQSAKAL